MNVDDSTDERPLAWMAITASTPVFTSDGTEIGGVHEVLGAEDIFHGLVVKSGPMAHEVMIPAEHVEQITNRRVTLSLTAEDVRNLPLYRPEETFGLGIVGLFQKHLGWVEENDKPG